MPRTPHPPAVTDRDVPLLLAVYGTLRRGCRNHHVLAGAVPVADGEVEGVLHEVAGPVRLPYPYPLLVLPAPGRVVVEVYRVRQERVLRGLDVLESYDPDDPAGSEYVRVRVPLLGAAAGPPEVQVYACAGGEGVLGRSLPGDWTAHLGAVGPTV